MHLVLFDMHNGTFGPYLAAINGILISLVSPQDHYEALRSRLIKAVDALATGDPKDEATFVGPLIAEKEAERVEEWVKEAVSMGVHGAWKKPSNISTQSRSLGTHFVSTQRGP
jgi:acyl-CoA reductase-like NAD-dependent aldehyde dehydrogenase